ncbi:MULTISPECIES: hypothetical protein [unclassified Microbacterium]|uniref:hypothetical protein n=1 Tax=unclassified Microbacterium TaxID=2609290 RepID=UPI00214CCD07|nr:MULTISPECIES: hypothetical protein [unclassified Microbacterium]MCR2801863.1 hypothetical protein [Microbacterium sp. zg.Y818]MCR2825412.1 hypothetical protein [Microbacterium sp. zg.Y909]WIM22877.1 hypothetical protein QNO21_02240 [Microbacterium sp. zg-Y818]
MSNNLPDLPDEERPVDPAVESLFADPQLDDERPVPFDEEDDVALEIESQDLGS